MMVEIDNEYLAHKHQGGASSKKGNRYEDFYAIYQIIKLMANKHLDAIVYSQVEAYVDDLKIDMGDGASVFCQLKDVKKLSWGNIDVKGTLAYDFFHQGKVCKEKNDDFSLRLVVSSQVEKMMTGMPVEISEYSNVEDYPSYGNLNRYIYDSNFYQIVALAFGLGAKEHEVASNYVTFLFGLWCGERCEGMRIEGILGMVEQVFVSSSVLDEQLVEELMHRLQQFAFEVKIEKATLSWKFDGFEGKMDLSNEKISELLKCSDVESIIGTLY